jgi:cellulose synthase/poly-beta-1,6-N-acetylglucosamine synthase-like glycosyltransferase
MTASGETPAPDELRDIYQGTRKRSTHAEADFPAIAVVVPTFNDAHRLGDALRSIVGQTLTPSEIVVADDGSTDGTENPLPT